MVLSGGGVGRLGVGWFGEIGGELKNWSCEHFFLFEMLFIRLVNFS